MCNLLGSSETPRKERMRYRDTTFDFEPCQEKGVELCEVERNLIRIQAFNASHSTAVRQLQSVVMSVMSASIMIN